MSGLHVPIVGADGVVFIVKEAKAYNSTGASATTMNVR